MTGLSVYAQGVYPVQLVCQTPEGIRRVDVRARVDVSTGRVEFCVPPDQIDRVR